MRTSLFAYRSMRIFEMSYNTFQPFNFNTLETHVQFVWNFSAICHAYFESIPFITHLNEMLSPNKLGIFFKLHHKNTCPIELPTFSRSANKFITVWSNPDRIRKWDRKYQIHTNIFIDWRDSKPPWWNRTLLLGFVITTGRYFFRGHRHRPNWPKLFREILPFSRIWSARATSLSFFYVRLVCSFFIVVLVFAAAGCNFRFSHDLFSRGSRRRLRIPLSGLQMHFGRIFDLSEVSGVGWLLTVRTRVQIKHISY